MRSCPEQLLSDLKDQQSPGRLWQECDPRKAGTRKKIPSSDLKIALEKRQRKLLLSPSSSPFLQELSLLSLSSYVNSDLFYYFFFSFRSQSDPVPTLPAGTIPARLHFHRNSKKTQKTPNLDLCGTAILGSSLERSRSSEIAFFFGPDPLPKAIKSSQRIKCTIFQQLNLAFLHRGTRGEGKAIKLQVFFSAHS